MSVHRIAFHATAQGPVVIHPVDPLACGVLVNTMARPNLDGTGPAQARGLPAHKPGALRTGNVGYLGPLDAGEVSARLVADGWPVSWSRGGEVQSAAPEAAPRKSRWRAQPNKESVA